MATTHELEVQLTSHEAVCAERYQTFIQRVDRLERLLIVAAGTLIVGMGSILTAVILRGV
jgi:hypothetical protein